MSREVRFRPLAADDAPLQTRWLNQPHVRAFYQHEPITLDEVLEEYGDVVRGAEPSFSHIALSDDGAPFGYIQFYRNVDYLDYAHVIGAYDGISVDLYVGEPAFLGAGWGRAMLASYLRDVAFPKYPDENRCYIAHEPGNVAALRCSTSVGFRPLRMIVEEGVADQLLVLERFAAKMGAK
ncbi:MAG TPA: GNAT family N-acetyltransferase [Caulobacteraceae bacterium]